MNEQTAPDFRIAYDGTWFHNGQPIKREALAKLFSDRALKRDDQGLYWLQTPYEKYPVEVEDVPYIIVDYIQTPEGLDFTTNMQETVKLGPAHPLELKICRKTQQILPYIDVRAGLYARLSRPVFYNLVQAYGPSVLSRGQVYALGESLGAQA
jgi:hypothetical protein